MIKSHSRVDMPLFRMLGIEEIDDSAAELGICRTIIQAHLGKVRSKNIDRDSERILHDIMIDILLAMGTDVLKQATQLILSQLEAQENGTQ